MRIFVLLFNVGTDNEGIHSLRVGDRDIVLMFEDEDDATRFALMLEAQDFPPATIELMEQDEIQEFCDSVGYDTKFLPTGSLAIPPEDTVDAMDWREDGQYDQERHGEKGDRVSDYEPIAGSAADDGDNGLSEAELNRLRRQLEKLL
ncbi:MAG: DUF3110 domain-containing protein [Leptolyngbyaceae bacterium]|nr:DUF3110 domain-containing protein [Leptolyngbyaceae bacterium]